jgi:hypothetical protein
MLKTSKTNPLDMEISVPMIQANKGMARRKDQCRRTGIPKILPILMEPAMRDEYLFNV